MKLMLLLHVFASLLLTTTTQSESSSVFLPFLELSDNASNFTGVDDSTTLLTFPQPFYFNSISYNSAYISSNGLVSFGSSFTEYNPQTFPLGPISDPPVIAPYWNDIDLTDTGNVYFESVINLSTISDYITDSQGSIFTCTSAVVVKWSEVCPIGNSICGNLTNSFQVVLASSRYNYTSYAIFTYKCGALNWVEGNATIGFSGGQDFYANHNLSKTSDVNDIACLNEPTSPWSNVVYKLDGDDHQTPPLSCTSECNPHPHLPEYYECCDSDNFGNFIKVMESGSVKRYIMCPSHQPDWC